MDLTVTFLGTGGSVPTARRSTASVLVSRGGERLMFDCGEGTQRQLQKSLGLVQVDEIFFTHFHADHLLGLPGLLKSWDLGSRETPLTIYGPPGLEKLFLSLEKLFGRTRYPVTLEEMQAGERLAGDGYEIEAFAVNHRVPAFGYALREDSRPGRFDARKAEELGVSAGRDFGRLQAGEEVSGSSGAVKPDQVMGESRPGRTVVITGDTAPAPETAAAADGAQLLIHDSSFADAEVDRAAETGHSTARQAATLAAQADVGMLALVHVSSRYHVGAVLDEAREEFDRVVAPRDFDEVQIPFPERGEPQLVRNGARERGEAAEKAVDTAQTED
jgi:ribonuclease Z